MGHCNAVGAADFTPGAMINMQPNSYRGCRPNSAAMGTRAFQMALYVITVLLIKSIELLKIRNFSTYASANVLPSLSVIFSLVYSE